MAEGHLFARTFGHNVRPLAGDREGGPDGVTSGQKFRLLCSDVLAVEEELRLALEKLPTAEAAFIWDHIDQSLLFL